jgi:hypothetical protein
MQLIHIFTKLWGTAQLMLSPLFWLGDFRMTHYKPALFIKPSQYYILRFADLSCLI